MSRVLVDDLSACADCAMMIANGTVGNEDETEDRAHGERMIAHCEGQGYDGVLVVDRHSDDFATNACDTCGSPLAGSRFSVAILSA